MGREAEIGVVPTLPSSSIYHEVCSSESPSKWPFVGSSAPTLCKELGRQCGRVCCVYVRCAAHTISTPKVLCVFMGSLWVHRKQVPGDCFPAWGVLGGAFSTTGLGVVGASFCGESARERLVNELCPWRMPARAPCKCLFVAICSEQIHKSMDKDQGKTMLRK